MSKRTYFLGEYDYNQSIDYIEKASQILRPHLHQYDHFDGQLTSPGERGLYDLIDSQPLYNRKIVLGIMYTTALDMFNQSFPPKNKSVGGLIILRLLERYGSNPSYAYEGMGDEIVKSLREDDSGYSQHMRRALNKMAELKAITPQKAADCHLDRMLDEDGEIQAWGVKDAIPALMDLTNRCPLTLKYVTSNLAGLAAKHPNDIPLENQGTLSALFAKADVAEGDEIKKHLLFYAEHDSKTYSRMLAVRGLQNIIHYSPESFTAEDYATLLSLTEKTMKDAVNLEPEDANQLLADHLIFWTTALDCPQAKQYAAKVHEISCSADQAAQQLSGEDWNWGIVLKNGRDLLVKTSGITGQPIPELTSDKSKAFMLHMSALRSPSKPSF